MKEDNVVSPVAAILIVVMTFLLILFLGGIIFVIFQNVFALIFQELLIVVIPLGYMLAKKVNVKSYIGLDTKPKNIMIGIAFGAFLFFFDIFVTSILVSIFGPSSAVEESNTMIADFSSSLQGAVSIAFLLALAGVCEEFTFRGFLQNSLSRRYSFIPAVLISSLAWGLFHFDPQLVYIISVFFAGLVLGYIYNRTHSYVVSASAHATLNLIVLALLLLRL